MDRITFTQATRGIRSKIKPEMSVFEKFLTTEEIKEFEHPKKLERVLLDAYVEAYRSIDGQPPAIDLEIDSIIEDAISIMNQIKAFNGRNEQSKKELIGMGVEGVFNEFIYDYSDDLSFVFLGVVTTICIIIQVSMTPSERKRFEDHALFDFINDVIKS